MQQTVYKVVKSNVILISNSLTKHSNVYFFLKKVKLLMHYLLVLITFLSFQVMTFHLEIKCNTLV